MRLFLAVMFGVAAVMPISIEANAASRPKRQLCTGTALDNTKVSFKCKASEKCCFDAIAKKGRCVAASNTLCL